MSETGYALGKMPEPQNGEEVKECLRHSREVLHKVFGDLFGRTTFDFALEYIQQLESAQPKWISVEDRLPEEGVIVLVYFDGVIATSEIVMLDMLDGKPMWSYTGASGDPTHWMPLPEPPKEET